MLASPLPGQGVDEISAPIPAYIAPEGLGRRTQSRLKNGLPVFGSKSWIFGDLLKWVASFRHLFPAFFLWYVFAVCFFSGWAGLACHLQCFGVSIFDLLRICKDFGVWTLWYFRAFWSFCSFDFPSFLLASSLRCFLAYSLPCLLASLLTRFLAYSLPCLLACLLPSFLHFPYVTKKNQRKKGWKMAEKKMITSFWKLSLSLWPAIRRMTTRSWGSFTTSSSVNKCSVDLGMWLIARSAWIELLRLTKNVHQNQMSCSSNPCFGVFFIGFSMGWKNSVVTLSLWAKVGTPQSWSRSRCLYLPEPFGEPSVGRLTAEPSLPCGQLYSCCPRFLISWLFL